jgi:tetratricopeptide (TPR) repeat protein
MVMRIWSGTLAAFVFSFAGALHAETGGQSSGPTEKQSSGAAEKPSSSSDKEARKLFYQGDRLYEEGKYEEAVAAFEKAYALSHRPELLFNLANAYERLGQYEEALRALRDFAPSAPESDRDKIAERIKTLEARAEDRRKRESEKAAAAAPATPAAAPPPPPAEPESKPPILAYTLMGGGVVALGIGTVFGVMALGSKSDAEDQCAKGGVCPASAQKSIDDAKGQALIADIAFAVGAVAAGTGLVLFLTRDTSPTNEHAAALRAAPRPGGGEVQFVTNFF